MPDKNKNISESSLSLELSSSLSSTKKDIIFSNIFGSSGSLGKTDVCDTSIERSLLKKFILEY